MEYDYYNAVAAAVGFGALAVIYLILLAVLVLIIIGTWKVFTKAGKPGWASLIPFYSQYCLWDISCGTGWFFLLTLIPCVGIFAGFYVNIKLAQAFGKGIGYGILLILLGGIFYPVLGFGSAEYIGPQEG